MLYFHQVLRVGPALGQGLQNSGQAHPGRCINPAGPSKLRLRMKSASEKMNSSTRKPVEAPKRASALQHGSTRGAPSLKVVHEEVWSSRSDDGAKRGHSRGWTLTAQRGSAAGSLVRLFVPLSTAMRMGGEATETQG